MRVEKNILMLEEDIKFTLGINHQATATVNCWGDSLETRGTHWGPGGPSQWLCRSGPQLGITP